MAQNPPKCCVTGRNNENIQPRRLAWHLAQQERAKSLVAVVPIIALIMSFSPCSLQDFLKYSKKASLDTSELEVLTSPAGPTLCSPGPSLNPPHPCLQCPPSIFTPEEPVPRRGLSSTWMCPPHPGVGEEGGSPTWGWGGGWTHQLSRGS